MPEKPRSRADINAEQSPPARWVRMLAYGVVAGGLLSCLACGYLVYLIKPVVSDDPQLAANESGNILTFKPMDGYVPKGTIIWPMFSLLNLKAVYYENPGANGTLVVIEVGSNSLNSNPRVKSHLEQMLREKNGVADALQIESVVRDEVTVQSRKRVFEMSEAIDPATKAKYKLVEGTVTSIMNNPVYIGLRYEDTAQKPGEPTTGNDRLPDPVRKMLESIQ